MPRSDTEWLSVNDALTILRDDMGVRIGRRKLYELVQARQVDHIRVGRNIRFNRAQLRKLVEEHLVVHAA